MNKVIVKVEIVSALASAMETFAKETIKAQAASGAGASFDKNRVSGIVSGAIVNALESLGIVPDEFEAQKENGEIAGKVPAKQFLLAALKAGLESGWLSQGATMLAESRKAGIYAADQAANVKAKADNLLSQFKL